MIPLLYHSKDCNISSPLDTTYISIHYVQSILILFLSDWLITEKPTMYGVWENLTGKESKTENPGDLRLLEKSFDKGIRKERIFFWKNPRCFEFSVVESFTKVILSFFKLEANLCVVGQQWIFTFQTDLVTSKFLAQ